jgi:hypothetical protein
MGEKMDDLSQSARMVVQVFKKLAGRIAVFLNKIRLELDGFEDRPLDVPVNDFSFT